MTLRGNVKDFPLEVGPRAPRTDRKDRRAAGPRRRQRRRARHRRRPRRHRGLRRRRAAARARRDLRARRAEFEFTPWDDAPPANLDEGTLDELLRKADEAKKRAEEARRKAEEEREAARKKAEEEAEAASRPGDSSPHPTKNRRKGPERATLGILRPAPWVAAASCWDKRRNALGLQGAPPLQPGVATGAQEAGDDAAIPRPRTGGGPAHVLQVLGIPLQPVLRSGMQRRWGNRWQEPLLLPEGKQSGEPRSRFRTAPHRRRWQATHIARDEGGIHVGKGIALLG